MPSLTDIVRRSLLLSLTPLAAVVVRADLEIDDNISLNCQSICRPVRQLSLACNVDDDVLRIDQLTEDALEAQCFCTNKSFDVRAITGLCASCIQQNPVADNDGDVELDDIRDVSEIMLRCGFPSTTYAIAQSTAADGIVVAATPLTNTAQLTATATAIATLATSLRTTTFTFTTSNGAGGLTVGTATATLLATGVVQTPVSTGGSTTTSAAAAVSHQGVLGWKATLGYAVGVAAMAAWFL